MPGTRNGNAPVRVSLDRRRRPKIANLPTSSLLFVHNQTPGGLPGRRRPGSPGHFTCSCRPSHRDERDATLPIAPSLRLNGLLGRL